MDLGGASVLVTGASRGIGRAVALALASAGAKVAIVARTTRALEAVAAEITAAGGQALAIAGDLCDPSLPDLVVKQAVAAHGRLQILVNNAGTLILGNVADTTDRAWDRMVGLNLTAPFRLTRAALPHLCNGGGHVVMISSLAGTNPVEGMAPYCATKAALEHFASGLTLEVRDQGVRVTVVAPGSVDTGFSDMPHRGDTTWMLKSEDVAAAVVDLLRGREAALLSRIEIRPARPPQRWGA
jgi:3-oxoacyl-[acyl-carrier protein] reductase